MGIPSYFRRLLQAYPACRSRSLAGPAAAALYFDFNCLIYRCIRGPGMIPYPGDLAGDDAQTTWREALWTEIRRTVKEVWAAAGRPREVMLAVDGVVPMAKIRQQRVRRFKSAWLRSNTDAETSAWDQNAITPGTEFMERLGVMLKEMCRQEGTGWSVSGADEPGEGEHKIMAKLRSFPVPRGLTVVYGLDADLILLCMLTEAKTDTPLMLIRETQEFEGGRGAATATPEGYTFLNIGEVRRRLGLTTEESVVNYVGLMSLMGNDFLPHSLTYKLNDDGHEAVLEVMRGAPLVIGQGQSKGIDARWVIDVARFKEICASWAADEQMRFVQMIQKKKLQARRGPGKGMDESEALPLQWNVESVFEDNGQLRADWRDTYWSFIHDGSTHSRKELCHEYVRGLQWILDYYTGRPIDLQWLFPAWIPPLWADFAGVDVGRNIEAEACGAGIAPIQPQEQLAMVLPVESWGLVRDRRLRGAPRTAPQFWPRTFGFFSFGRTWLWQCEARVPVLMVERLRACVADKV